MGAITMSCNSSIPVKSAHGIGEMPQSKGRIASKLSSRHNRRKRRDRESNERSAKKSRNGKTSRDKIPIPSFTPITGEDDHEGAARDDGADAETTEAEASSFACPTGCDSTTKPISLANAAGAKADGKATNQTGNADYNVNGGATMASFEIEKKDAENPTIMSAKDECQKSDVQQIDPRTNGNVNASARGSSDKSIENTSPTPNTTESSPLTSLSVAALPARKREEQPSATSSSDRLQQVGDCAIIRQKGYGSTENNPLANMAEKTPGAALTASGAVPQTEKEQSSGQTDATIPLPNKSLQTLGSGSCGNQQSNLRMETVPSKRSERANKSSTEETCCKDNQIKECRKNRSSHKDFDHPNSKRPKENEPDLEVVTLPDIAAKTTKSAPSKESNSPILVKEAKKIEIICPGETNIKNTRSTKPRASEVIEIIDDDHDVGRATIKAKKEPAAKSVPPKKAPLGKKRKTNKSNQPKKKRKPLASISRSSSDSFIDEDAYDMIRPKETTDQKSATNNNMESVVGKTQSKKSGGKKCLACSSCTCNSRAGNAAKSQEFSALSGSDARQEQSLLNRIKRTEKDIQNQERQLNNHARAYQKHRNEMRKKWENMPANSKAQRPQFLADAEVDEQFRGLGSKCGTKETSRARKRIFGKEKTHQPTLTQIMRGPNDDDEDEKLPSSANNNNNNIIIHCNDKGNGGDKVVDDASRNAKKKASLPNSHDNCLSFRADTTTMEDPMQCLGTMDDFNFAKANVPGIKRTGKWAKAIANTLKIEEDEGFDALLNLFEESLEQNSIDGDVNSCSSEGCSLVDEDRPLSPRGKRVASQIEKSVEEDLEKKAAIERMCPQWEENVELAQTQTDPNKLQDALHCVRDAKMSLERMKARIMHAFNDRQQTLELYEKSLQGSIDRLSEEADEGDCID